MLFNLISISIYVLGLEDNKFYITSLPKYQETQVESFITNSNITDLESVFGNGSHWLRLYPIKNIYDIENNIKDCDYVLKYYMKKYGFHNVRGCNINNVAYQQDEYSKIVNKFNIVNNRINEEIQEYKVNQCSLEDNEDCIGTI